MASKLRDAGVRMFSLASVISTVVRTGVTGSIFLLYHGVGMKGIANSCCFVVL